MFQKRRFNLYNEQGKLIRFDFKSSYLGGNRTEINTYTNEGKLKQKEFFSSEAKSISLFDENENCTEESVYSPQGTLLKKDVCQYNSDGKLLKTISEHYFRKNLVIQKKTSMMKKAI